MVDFFKLILSNLIYGNFIYYINRNNNGIFVSISILLIDIKLGYVFSVLFNLGNLLNNNINGGVG